MVSITQMRKKNEICLFCFNKELIKNMVDNITDTDKTEPDQKKETDFVEMGVNKHNPSWLILQIATEMPTWCIFPYLALLRQLKCEKKMLNLHYSKSISYILSRILHFPHVLHDFSGARFAENAEFADLQPYLYSFAIANHGNKLISLSQFTCAK